MNHLEIIIDRKDSLAKNRLSIKHYQRLICSKEQEEGESSSSIIKAKDKAKERSQITKIRLLEPMQVIRNSSLLEVVVVKESRMISPLLAVEE